MAITRRCWTEAWKTWIAESRKTSTDEVHPAHAHFTPQLQPDILVSTAQMRELSLAVNQGVSDYVLLDARPLAEFTGIVNSEAVPKAGHIAGSQSLYWKKLIRSEANPQLLDPRTTATAVHARRRRARQVGYHLLPHRHAVVIYLFRRKVPGISGCHVRRLGLRVGSRSGQRTREVACAGAREHERINKESLAQFDGGNHETQFHPFDSRRVFADEPCEFGCE